MKRRGGRGAGSAIGAGVLALALGLGAPGAAAARSSGGDEPTRETMGRIFSAIRILLPASVSQKGFEDPAQREALAHALASLARNAGQLEDHGLDRDESFSFLSRSLAYGVRDIQARFEAGKPREAQFMFLELVDTCVACHARLPSDDSRLAERLLEGEALATLSIEERAKLEMATRQFGKALESYEAALRSPGSSISALDFMGQLDDYVELAIRVKQDPGRAIPVLEAVAGRPDVSSHLRENLGYWLASLRELAAEPLPYGLAPAQKLLEQAEDRERFPTDRAALVPYVAASSALLRWVTDHPDPSLEASRAFYALGQIESRIGTTAWPHQTEFYLVTSIHMAPGSDTAQQAYALLEEFVISGYTGSGGTHVPDDLQLLLDELQRMIRISRDRARAAPPAAGSEALQVRAAPAASPAAGEPAP